jgi:hypothetical protein
MYCVTLKFHTGNDGSAYFLIQASRAHMLKPKPKRPFTQTKLANHSSAPAVDGMQRAALDEPIQGPRLRRTEEAGPEHS